MQSSGTAKDEWSSGLRPSHHAPRLGHLWIPAGLLTLAIFLVDILTPIDGAVAVLYVVVVLISGRSGRRRDTLIAAGVAILLTIYAYADTHGFRHIGSPTLRVFVSLAAIAIAGVLVLQGQTAAGALLRSERRYRRMFDASRIGIVEEDWRAIRSAVGGAPQDRDATVRRLRGLIRIVDVNPAMLVMLGWDTAAPIIGTAHNFLMVSERIFAETLDAYLRGDAFFEAEAEIMRANGNTLPALLSITFPPREDPDGTVLIFVVDTTERRQAQHALLRAQAELAHAARTATLGELSASIAHEVNQPLMAVVTSGEAGLRWLRRDEPDLAEVEQSITRIVAEGRRASQIVARIRSFVKKAPVQMELLDVATLVEDSVLLVESELSTVHVVLDRAVAPGLPALRGDRIQLQQILVNLMVNASQAMAAQSAPRRLRIAAHRDGEDRILITVGDTGPGIAPEDLPRLFEPFFTTRQEGLGMGLAICRTTAEAHGGRLAVESCQGEGTAFILRLPAAETELA
ncbi:PAS domain-containing sensor histidine kinase [Neoroseomonas lacus]|uniref:C4-dicarboxylate transport sensor protein DctB n=1 Tax=Neoroseomonas lacus TaxID=287609 RepID=A0A917KBB0_9PROT|nr:ATP-binding protein [Neoroseomonas lacus]GGJ04753.1 hypothetical protein GCM10011320_09580 [Neoroseomonas lacus]